MRWGRGSRPCRVMNHVSVRWFIVRLSVAIWIRPQVVATPTALTSQPVIGKRDPQAKVDEDGRKVYECREG